MSNPDMIVVDEVSNSDKDSWFFSEAEPREHFIYAKECDFFGFVFWALDLPFKFIDWLFS